MNMDSQTQQVSLLQDYAILNLRLTVEQFLVFFFKSCHSSSSVSLRYDSKQQLFVLEGHSMLIKKFHSKIRDLLGKYSATSFSLGFEAATLMNYLVGSIAKRPTIKYYNSRQILHLNELENIHISIDNPKKTFMLGPISELYELKKQVVIYLLSCASKLASRVAMKACMQGQEQHVSGGTEQEKMLEQLSNEEEQAQRKKKVQERAKRTVHQQRREEQDLAVQKQELEKLERQIKASKAAKSNRKSVSTDEPEFYETSLQIPKQGRQSQHPKREQFSIQAKLFDNGDIFCSTLAVSFLQNELVFFLKQNVPDFTFETLEGNENNTIKIKGKICQESKKTCKFTVNQFMKHVGFEIIPLLNVMTRAMNDKIGQFIDRNKHFHLFKSDDDTKIVNFYYKYNGKNNAARMINQILGKKQQNKKNSSKLINKAQIEKPKHQKNQKISSRKDQQSEQLLAQIPPSEKKVSPKLSKPPSKSEKKQEFQNQKIYKRQIKIPELISEDIFEFAERKAKNYDQMTLSTNPASQITFKSSFRHLYSDKLLVLKGPKAIVEKFAALVQDNIALCLNGKKTSNFQISHQSSELLKSLKSSNFVREKCILNPPIVFPFSIKTEVMSINLVNFEVCDLLIDNFNSILLFDRAKDLDASKNKNSQLRNILVSESYSRCFVCDNKQQRQLPEIMVGLVREHENKMQQQSEPLKVFIFTQWHKLISLAYDLAALTKSATNRSLDLFLVQSGKNINDIDKIEAPVDRFYIAVDSKLHYTAEGDRAIREAKQKGDRFIYLNSDHVMFNRDNFRVDIKQRKLVGMAYNFSFQYEEKQNTILFQLNGMELQLGSSRYREIKQAEKNGLQSIEISLSVFKVNLETMKQKNLFSNYERQIEWAEKDSSHRRMQICRDKHRYMVHITGESAKDLAEAKSKVLKIMQGRGE